MTKRCSSRLVLAGALGVLCPASAGWGQGSGLPVTAPTGALSGSAGAGGASRGPKRATVEYTGGLLEVTANNSSLNQILREIGRLTGMKISGGVQEDRVFGTYGPLPASEVLAKLLDGTPSNFLIVENEQGGPAELVLTQRKGGPSPPNPNAAIAEEQEPPLPQQQQVIQQSQPIQLQPGPGGPPGAGGLPASNGGQTGTPVSGGANLGSAPGAFAGFGQTPQDATAQPAPTSSDGTDGQSGNNNGVATPQQIYEQLQRLRQQQQANPTPSPQ